MIPKKIHYCWFGRGKKSKLFYKCLKSWKKYFPDYEIIEWNEDNFDVSCNEFTKSAYENKKYAFLSDYARLMILYENGGIYFDTDVEVLKRIPDKILENGYFAKENDKEIATGLGFAVEKGNKFIKYMMEDYESLKDCSNVLPCPVFNTKSLEKKGFDISKLDFLDDIKIYDRNYFCGYDIDNNCYIISDKTYTVHHYDSSWIPKKEKYKRNIKRVICNIIGVDNYKKIRNYKKSRDKK